LGRHNEEAAPVDDEALILKKVPRWTLTALGRNQTARGAGPARWLSRT